jgi:glycine/D-amino acid oxidase-like deaminating enzyme/nitrite reductase/ring-hydroxylating ferredoxin subunit
MGSGREINPSLWVATAPDALTEASTQASGSFDIVVIGAGITGLTTARLLASEGSSVAVVEAGAICSGVTTYTTAKVTALQQTTLSAIAERHGGERAAMYAAANLAAVDAVAARVAEDAIDCDFERAPACTYTEVDEKLDAVVGEHEACTKAGLATRLDTATELPYPVRAAVWLDEQAQFHPRRYCLGLAAALRSSGGTIFEHTRALDVEDVDGKCTVTTDRGTVQADRVVVATLLPFLSAGGFFARAHPYRSYAMAVRTRADRVRGMYISAESPTRSIRSTPDGWLIIGGEGHKVGQDADTTRRYAALGDWASERFAVDEIGYRWSAHDYETIDGVPYVGSATSGSERILVATGFRKWGMSNGTAAAMILADLIAGRHNPWAEAFDATRLAPGASIKRLIAENLDVGRRFVADRIRSWRPRPSGELTPGEGDVVEVDGEAVAAFRDESGGLHAVSATCTHLGCRVTFNTAERSWDCPCHGSRFDTDGRLIQGPAVEDLASKRSS